MMVNMLYVDELWLISYLYGVAAPELEVTQIPKAYLSDRLL